MERLKNMGLKKAFFLLSLCGLLVSLCLFAVIWFACQNLMDRYPSGGIAIGADGQITEFEKPTPEENRIREVLSVIPFFFALVCPVLGLGVSGMLFYRWKLKKELALLREGTERIRAHDLDFSFPAVSKDELGEVCGAFESMRAELQKTNRELWRQSEERKRLNAAFAHDLRNPVTVLKGTVRLLKENRQDAQAIERLETYTMRIERYIEVMSSVQKLEQIPVKKKETAFSVLRRELEETALLLRPSLAVEMPGGAGQECRGAEAGRKDGKSRAAEEERTVMLDHGIFLNVAENLIGNACRFAEEKLKITLWEEKDMLMLSVADDGPGFSAKMLTEGPKPFGRGEKDNRHFGMGLYVSSLLCIRHGGNLWLKNGEEGGALVTAVFYTGR